MVNISETGKEGDRKMAIRSYYSCSSVESGKDFLLPVTPGSFTLGASANFAEQNMLGRSHPLSAYINSGARSFSFSFIVHRDMWGSDKVAGEMSGLEGADQMDQLLDHFQKMVLPAYSMGTIIPPITRFSFGNFLFKGYVTSLTFSPVEGSAIKHSKYSAYSISVQMTSIFNERSPDASKQGYELFYKFTNL